MLEGRGQAPVHRIDIYDRRIAQIQAKYFLIDGSDPVYYNCNDNSDEVVSRSSLPSRRAFEWNAATVRRSASASPWDSGSRYDADFGVFFWTNGDNAQLAWPQDQEVSTAR
jgi:membrane-bound inhibitor of C-type lysozyme